MDTGNGLRNGVWGRVQVRGQWRPASLKTDGTMFVSPASDLAWRSPTRQERDTWQERIPARQHTIGRIWDDALYLGPATSAHRAS